MKLSPIFVGGAGRSGTTLLRVILDAHPSIACGPELKITPALCQLWLNLQTAFLPALEAYGAGAEDVNDAVAGMLGRFLGPYLSRSQKSRIAEKSPNNVFFFEHLHLIFPESPLVHVIRDGRDVVCSLLTMNWVDPTTGAPIDYTRDVQKAAEYWVKAVRAGRTAEKNVEGRCFELRYERLVADPEPTLRALFTFLDEPWDARVLRYHEDKHRNLAGESSATQVSKPIYAAASGRWSRDLTAAQKAIVKDVAGPLLIELGYATDLDW
ncbi:MAG: sulfotransferase [Deltaproteobacteria bacterium]|nr:sulfotransferase [Deltaproteobacteria bacterium]